MPRVWIDPTSLFAERPRCDIDDVVPVFRLPRTANRRRVSRAQKITKGTRKKETQKRKPIKEIKVTRRTIKT
jgi:hypothetical protein